MPIVLRELIIKATVTQDGSSEASGSNSGAGTPKSEEIIKTCIEKVMEIIREKYGR